MNILIHSARSALTRLRDLSLPGLVAADPLHASGRLIAECMPHLGATGIALTLYTCDVVCIGRTGSPLGREPLAPPPCSWQESVVAFAKTPGQVADFDMRIDHERIVEEVIDRSLSMTIHEIVVVPVGEPWSLRYMARGNRRRPPAPPQQFQKAA